jgi:ribose/xylose/arabinose/galactoside ABC-type transport system permease subunit
MMEKIGAFISNNRRFLPLSATVALFFVAYAFGAISYEGMRDPQVFLNLFRSSHYLLISAIGMTFVILTGGIDLSVSGVVALTTVASAALLREGWNPWAVMVLMLAMGMALGATMGAFITYMKVQPFIATLAGMWFARGMCFFISDDAISINDRVYRILGMTKILIPGLADPVTKTGDFITILVVVALAVLAVAIYIAHFTRFGRTVYAIGGNEGRNEQSARLMGLPVNRTKMLVYTLNGFCSALAGIMLSIYVLSGHGLYAQIFELDVIASVVMGGTMLSGGAGYVFGTLFGVLVNTLIQTLIQFDGRFSSWWIRIVIGALTLMFIGVQSLLAARKTRQLASKKLASQAKEAAAQASKPRNRQMLVWGSGAIGALVVIVAAVLAINAAQNAARGPAANTNTPTPQTAACQDKPFRQDQAASLLKAGAVLVYERNGGPTCLDELYSVYPDGRIVGDDGAKKIEKQVTPADVDKLLSAISDKGWFTDEMYDTWHTRCGQCFGYYLTVSYKGKEKTVKAVDGGTDAPANYWQVVSAINGVIPHFTP